MPRATLCVVLTLALARPALAASATITVDTGHPGRAFPRDAIGLSYEMRTVGEGGFDAATGNEAAVFSALGVHDLRIGGNTVDYGTFWQPGGKPVPPWASIIITPADVQRVAAFAKAIDAKVAWAVNLQHLDEASIDDEVAAVVAAFGEHLGSIQCGNEPNGIFAGYAAFKASFDRCRDAIKGRAKISGPDTYGGASSWNPGFAADEAMALVDLNYHYYTGARSVAALLAPAAIDGAMKAIGGSLAAAQAHHLGYRTDETNSEAGGGIHGVSDVYGAALWAMDYALATASRGAGIDFHGFLGTCGHPTVNGKNDYYTPICAATADDQKAKVMTAGPEFYGLWMANHLGPGKFLPATVTGAANLVAYAVAGDDGATRVALIEKSATGNKVSVAIAVDGTGDAEVLRLTAPALSATTGIQVQDASLDRAGHLTPGAPDKIAIAGGHLTLDLATGSAALIAIGGSGPRPPADADGGGGSDPVSPDAATPAEPDSAMAMVDVRRPDPTPAPGGDAAEPEPDAGPTKHASSGGCAVAGGAPGGLALLLLLAFVRRARRH